MNSKPAQWGLFNKNFLHGDSRMTIIVEGNGGYSGNSAKWGEIQVSKVGIYLTGNKKITKSLGLFSWDCKALNGGCPDVTMRWLNLNHLPVLELWEWNYPGF